MLIVHFVSYATLICVTFSLPPGVGGWPRLLLVTLPGLFYLPFQQLLSEIYQELCDISLANKQSFSRPMLILQEE